MAKRQEQEKKLAFIPTKKSLPVPLNYFDFCNWLYPEIGANGLHCDPQGCHLEYHDAIVNYHDVILNKSRKIGATQSALKSFWYFIMTGFYAGRNGIIASGNEQGIANGFIERMLKLVRGKKFTLLDGDTVSWDYIVHKYSAEKIETFNGHVMQAFAATPKFGGLEDVIVCYISEAAKTGRINDNPVFTAFKPVVATMKDHHFILESTPLGQRGFFHDIMMYSKECIAKGIKPPFHPLEFPYTRALGTVLSPEVVEADRNNPQIDFEQEYCCKFSTSLSAAFKEEIVDANYIPAEVTNWSDILGDEAK